MSLESVIYLLQLGKAPLYSPLSVIKQNCTFVRFVQPYQQHNSRRHYADQQDRTMKYTPKRSTDRQNTCNTLRRRNIDIATTNNTQTNIKKLSPPQSSCETTTTPSSSARTSFSWSAVRATYLLLPPGAAPMPSKFRRHHPALDPFAPYPEQRHEARHIPG
jgi:hypothetical protein